LSYSIVCRPIGNLPAIIPNLLDPCTTIRVSVDDGGIGFARTDLDGLVLKSSDVKEKLALCTIFSYALYFQQCIHILCLLHDEKWQAEEERVKMRRGVPRL
jgi:hypothetical protein